MTSLGERTRTEADCAAIERLADRYPTLSRFQVLVLYDAVYELVNAWCWKDGTELEDMLDAITRELREWQDCAETRVA